MNITELLESWKGRAEKAEAELVKAAALINTSRNEAAVSSVTCGQMRKELERVQRELDHRKMWAEEIAICAKAELEKAHKEIGRVKAAAAEMRDAAEMLWTVVANVSGGDWTKQSTEWQTAAARWRDSYHKALANDAGTGYVRKEDVKPLMEALVDSIAVLGDAIVFKDDAYAMAQKQCAEAIAHAKAKGLTE